MLVINSLAGFGANTADEGIGGNDAFTKLLLHMEDGADASTTFTDSSATARTMTAVGTGQIDTAEFKFGTRSGLFASGGGGVSAPSSADWNYGTGDFTIDFWVRFSASTRQYLIDQGAGNVTALAITPSSGLIEVYGPASYVINGGSTPLNTGQWYHIALVRSGNNWTVYRDGTSYRTATDSRSWGGSNLLTIGYSAAGGAPRMSGWLDEVRVSKGIARWTSDFTPPTVAYS